jgi:outer membrane lipoprotein SlyB
MKTATFRSLTIAASAFVLMGCASTQPVVYNAGAANAERVTRDTQACRQRADAAVGLNQKGSMKSAKKSGEVGLIAAAGAAAGAAINNSADVMRRAGAAAAAGGVGYAVKELIEWNKPDEVYENYVERCMKERGHDVIGWR